MTPDNDKTLRGLFCKHEIGFDEWNDRRDYRLKYEKQYYHLTNKRRVGEFDFIIQSMYEESGSSIIKDGNSRAKDEEDYIMWIGKYFHETKLYQKMRYIWSFGMCRDEDGNFTECDCCGTKLNFFNTTGYGMCDICEIENKFMPKKSAKDLLS